MSWSGLARGSVGVKLKRPGLAYGSVAVKLRWPGLAHGSMFVKKKWPGLAYGSAAVKKWLRIVITRRTPSARIKEVIGRLRHGRVCEADPYRNLAATTTMFVTAVSRYVIQC